MVNSRFISELDKFKNELSTSHYNLAYFHEKLEKAYRQAILSKRPEERALGRKEVEETLGDLEKYTRFFGANIVNYFVRAIYPHLKANASNNMELVDSLMKTADFCDSLGDYEAASGFDKMALDVLESVPADTSLSTRYCPDHIGVSTTRIFDNTYQCPIDGKTYDYDTGFKNYKGQITPGGSVSAQTENSRDFGGFPALFFENSQTDINRQ